MTRKSSINGSSYLNNVRYNSLKHNGLLKFNDLTIKETLKSNGTIKGKDLTCKNLQSNGSLCVNKLEAKNIKHNGSFKAENIKVEDTLKVNGKTHITNGKLNNVEVKTTKATFINSKIKGDIFIQKSTSSWSFCGFRFNNWTLFNFGSEKVEKNILELKDNTIVMGDIKFEENGEIHLFDTSEIKGKVVNAQVIQK